VKVYITSYSRKQLATVTRYKSNALLPTLTAFDLGLLALFLNINCSLNGCVLTHHVVPNKRRVVHKELHAILDNLF